MSDANDKTDHLYRLTISVEGGGSGNVILATPYNTRQQIDIDASKILASIRACENIPEPEAVGAAAGGEGSPEQRKRYISLNWRGQFSKDART